MRHEIVIWKVDASQSHEPLDILYDVKNADLVYIIDQGK